MSLVRTLHIQTTLFADDGTPFRDVEENCWSLKRRIFDCDKRGVDVHVLSTVPIMFSYWAKPEVRRSTTQLPGGCRYKIAPLLQHALDLSMMLNDHMAACVATNPTRFVGMAMR